MLRSQERKEDEERCRDFRDVAKMFLEGKNRSARGRQVRAKLRGHEESSRDELRWEGGGGIKLSNLTLSCRQNEISIGLIWRCSRLIT